MALVLADRVKDTTTTTGTGTVTLSGTAPTGYQNFAVIGNGNTTYYTIAGGSEWEVGIGTYATSGPTLARTTVLASTNGGSAVSFSSGTKDVFVTYPAEVATALGNPTATNGGVVYGTGTAVNVSAAGTVNGYQFLQSAGAASPTWVQINSFKDVATAPTSPTPIEGDRFFDNTTGIDYTYITDVDGSQWVETAPGNLASVAGGSSTQVQYNNAGILGGITGATTNGTVLTLTTPVLGAATGTSLALGGATLGTNALAVTGTTQLNSALNYGGVTLSNAVTGTGNMVLSASPTLTGTPIVYQGTAAAVAPLRFNTVQDASATTWAIGQGNSTTNFYISGYSGGWNDWFSMTQAGVAQFGGKVGIGMTPSNVLDITQNQASNSYGNLLNNSSTGAAYWRTTNGTYESRFGIVGTAGAFGAFANNDTVIYGSSAISIATAGAIKFDPGNGGEAARFGTDGSFLIGNTTNAGAGNLSVSGVVHRTKGNSGSIANGATFTATLPTSYGAYILTTSTTGDARQPSMYLVGSDGSSVVVQTLFASGYAPAVAATSNRVTITNGSGGTATVYWAFLQTLVNA